jgi:hypothetical protein
MIWFDVDTALAEVPVNYMALIDDTDFKTREQTVTFDQAGLDLLWNFVTTAGAFTQTAVTPTESAGAYDWANQGNGLYTIEVPATGGASINNDTEGFGWFSGFATGILPWSGPICGFRAAGINNVLVDDAYSATRGFTGTAVPNAAADAAGGLPISDAGGLDLDGLSATTAVQAIIAAFTTDSNETAGTAVAGSVVGELVTLLDAIKAITDLLTAAHAEPTGAPAANETPLDKLAFVFMEMRNKKTVTSTKKTIFGDDDAAEYEYDLSDDGTTYTETEANAL